MDAQLNVIKDLKVVIAKMIALKIVFVDKHRGNATQTLALAML